MPNISKEKLLAIIDGCISDSDRLDKSDRQKRREDAIAFYDGRTDITIEEGHSGVVSPDVADALEWILPGLLRVFTSANNIAIYGARKEKDAAMAEQATDAINLMFLTECNGYLILKNGFHDALLHGNGLIKHWWDPSKIFKTEQHTGLNYTEYQALLAEETLNKVLEKRAYYKDAKGKDVELTEDELIEIEKQNGGYGQTA